MKQKIKLVLEKIGNVLIITLGIIVGLVGYSFIENTIEKNSEKTEETKYVLSTETKEELEEIENRFEKYQDVLTCTVCQGKKFLDSNVINYGLKTEYGTSKVKICKNCGHIELFHEFDITLKEEEDLRLDEWRLKKNNWHLIK